jgi:hypothetical protein
MIAGTIFFRLNDTGLDQYQTAPEMQEAGKELSAPSFEKMETESAAEAAETKKKVAPPIIEKEKAAAAAPDRTTVDKSLQQKGAGTPTEESKLPELKNFASDQTRVATQQPGSVTRQKSALTTEPSAGRIATLVAEEELDINDMDIVMDEEMEISAIEISEREAEERDEAVAKKYEAAKSDRSMKSTLFPDEISPAETVTIRSVDHNEATPVDGYTNYNSYIDSALVFPPLAQTGNREVVVLKFTIDRMAVPKTSV